MFEGIRVCSILLHPIMPKCILFCLLVDELATTLILDRIHISPDHIHVNDLYQFNTFKYLDIKQDKLVLYPKLDFEKNEDLKLFL